MKQSLKWLFLVSLAVTTHGWGKVEEKGSVRLPNPAYDGKVSVEQAIKERRTTRDFQPKPLTVAFLSKTVLVRPEDNRCKEWISSRSIRRSPLPT